MTSSDDQNIKTRVLSFLPPCRTGNAASPSLQELRVAANRMMEATELAPRVSISSRLIGGVACVVCSVPQARGTVVHVHGGGFRLGSASGWATFGSTLASACGLDVIMPDYGLAPEQPFPCALHEIAHAYVELAINDRGTPLLLSGDSAGGALAMSLALATSAAGITPSAVILFSPWLDLTLQSPTYTSCAATDAFFSRSAAEAAAELYLQGWSATDAIASPRFADLTDAPHTLIMASSAEVLLGDSMEMTKALALTGRPVDLHIFPEQPHDWPVLARNTEAARRSFEIAQKFTDRICASKNAI
jgi:epsilon-lactone hydrolase